MIRPPSWRIYLFIDILFFVKFASILEDIQISFNSYFRLTIVDYVSMKRVIFQEKSPSNGFNN